MGFELKRLCTVCARGGSKGVPGKNVRLLQGRPLIAHTVERAVVSGLFDAIAVSSDSDAILEAASAAGATHLVKRPDELATDQAGKLPAIVHCVREAEKALGVEVETVVDLDATSPLRAVSDIAGAVELFEESGATSVITGAPARRSPYFNLVEVGSDDIARLSKPTPQAVLRRQDAPPCYDMNASIYVWRRQSLIESPAVFYPDTRLFVMPEERSHDIDTELDFTWVSFLMERANASE